jgi:hypothetical protein
MHRKAGLHRAVLIALLAAPMACSAQWRPLPLPDLHGATVNTFAYDDQGALWLGTSKGLQLFDGANLTAFRSNPGDAGSLANDQVHTLLYDTKGTLWVGYRRRRVHPEEERCALRTSPVHRCGWDRRTPWMPGPRCQHGRWHVGVLWCRIYLSVRSGRQLVPTGDRLARGAFRPVHPGVRGNGWHAVVHRPDAAPAPRSAHRKARRVPLPAPGPRSASQNLVHASDARSTRPAPAMDHQLGHGPVGIR